MSKTYYVYIVANYHDTTTYIGVTSDIGRRLFEHKSESKKGFSQKYKTKKLVYYEAFEDVNEAIHREKCLKRWKREWKVNLINSSNPEWNDLSEGFYA